MQTNPESVCELCGGSGWISSAGSLNAAPCPCQKETRKKLRFAASHVPPRYAHCTLENFHDGDQMALRRAKRDVTEFIDCWPSPPKGLLMMGSCGAGKTHLAVAALLEIIRQDKPGKLLFSNFQDLVQEIQGSFDSTGTTTKADILQPVLEADLLVLDELGAQKPTQWVQDILYYIINTRYNQMRATIFTTNYLDRPLAASEESLEARIGQRLRSRLYTMTRPVEFSGADDYRRKVESKAV